MSSQRYEAQVRLLLRILPHVATEDCLALKGGTAINLFVRELPRLSVDIDLTYVPIAERDASLAAITESLRRIQSRLTTAIPSIKFSSPAIVDNEAKLVCLHEGANVKLEVNTVTRGTLWPTRLLSVDETVEDEFGLFAEISVVSHAELFGGKVAAALDRQHPRDLFDIKQLYEHEGLAQEVMQGLVVALVSHPRPIHELLRPNQNDRREAFDAQFAGMARQSFAYTDYEATRSRLFNEVSASLTDSQRAFLLSFVKGEPDWNLAPNHGIEKMPAVQWKLANIKKLITNNPKKHLLMLHNLRMAVDVR